MKHLKPPRVYVVDRVKAHPDWAARMEAMMANVDGPPVETITPQNVEDIVKANGLDSIGGVRRGEQDIPSEPVLIFSAFDWDYQPDGRSHMANLILGQPSRLVFYQDAFKIRRDQGRVCQPVYDFHTVFGCVNACDYCHAGGYVVVMLNVEEAIERIDQLIQRVPSQRLYKYDVVTDILQLEPEYGACKLLVEHFGRLGDPYLMVYSKTDNVEPLLDLDHRGRTIACWTFSSDTVSRKIDKGCPSMSRRIEAARKCKQAGYPVRFKLKPIVPIKNWQEENRAVLEEMFAKAPPDVLTLQTLSYMDYDACTRAFDMSLFDERFVQIMREHAAEMGTLDRRPLPHAARLEIYHWFLDEIRRISPRTPVSLCGETFEMWDALAGKIGMSPDSFVCNCGPQSTPDNLHLRPWEMLGPCR